MTSIQWPRYKGNSAFYSDAIGSQQLSCLLHLGAAIRFLCAHNVTHALLVPVRTNHSTDKQLSPNTLLWHFFTLHRSCGTVYLHTLDLLFITPLLLRLPMLALVSLISFDPDLYSPGLLSNRLSLVLTRLVFLNSFLFLELAYLHVIHQHNLLFDLTTLVFKMKLSLSCSIFISTINLLKTTLLSIITSSHTIPLF